MCSFLTQTVPDPIACDKPPKKKTKKNPGDMIDSRDTWVMLINEKKNAKEERTMMTL